MRTRHKQRRIETLVRSYTLLDGCTQPDKIALAAVAAVLLASREAEAKVGNGSKASMSGYDMEVRHAAVRLSMSTADATL